MTAHLVATGGYGLCAPHFDAEGTLWMVSSQTGEVLRLVSDGDKLVIAVAFVAGAHPCALAVQPSDGTLFLADQGHRSVLAVSPQGETSDFVSEYEQQPFLGPSALAFDGTPNNQKKRRSRRSRGRPHRLTPTPPCPARARRAVGVAPPPGKRNLYICDAGPPGETGLHSPKVRRKSARAALLGSRARQCAA